MWMIKPKQDAKILDLNDESQVDAITDLLKSDFDEGKLAQYTDLEDLVSQHVNDVDLWEKFKNEINPSDIVDSAGMFDVPGFTGWLLHSHNFGFVLTNDGAVCLDTEQCHVGKVDYSKIDKYSFNDGDGSRWITIGSEAGADGGMHGGHPVLIKKDGTILAGLGGKFTGKKLDQAFGDNKSLTGHLAIDKNTPSPATTAGADSSPDQQTSNQEPKKMQVKVLNKDFSYAVNFLKKRGFKFDPESKTWSGDGDISYLTKEGYITEYNPPNRDDAPAQSGNSSGRQASEQPKKMQSKLLGTAIESDATKYFMTVNDNGVQVELFLSPDGLILSQDGKWQKLSKKATVDGQTGTWEEMYEQLKSNVAKTGSEVEEVVK
jgi:hypothetical protein